MGTSIKITLLLLLHFLLLLSCSQCVGSSLPFSSCQMEGQFHVNGMSKSGDVVLGGLFQIHFFSIFADLTFTSEPEQPTCHGWVREWDTDYFWLITMSIHAVLNFLCKWKILAKLNMRIFPKDSNATLKTTHHIVRLQQKHCVSTVLMF